MWIVRWIFPYTLPESGNTMLYGPFETKSDASKWINKRIDTGDKYKIEYVNTIEEN